MQLKNVIHFWEAESRSCFFLLWRTPRLSTYESQLTKDVSCQCTESNLLNLFRRIIEMFVIENINGEVNTSWVGNTKELIKPEFAITSSQITYRQILVTTALKSLAAIEKRKVQVAWKLWASTFWTFLRKNSVSTILANFASPLL